MPQPTNQMLYNTLWWLSFWLWNFNRKQIWNKWIDLQKSTRGSMDHGGKSRGFLLKGSRIIQEPLIGIFYFTHRVEKTKLVNKSYFNPISISICMN